MQMPYSQRDVFWRGAGPYKLTMCFGEELDLIKLMMCFGEELDLLKLTMCVWRRAGPYKTHDVCLAKSWTL